MFDPPHSEPDLAGIALSNVDIIKLHAAVTMSICGALHEKGLVSHADMGAILSGQIRDEDVDPWANVVRAIAAALSRCSEAPPAAPPTQSRTAGLALIIGGLDQAEASHAP
ncbi:hypothetical protein DDF62_22410 [Caulobacter radicis]|uniref:hypothetical protein n=1 Tax=Caulobacter radicis TaxID=2172650 RepID=UPI000D57462E|nr:hypothetical protein [Caulobacter radicis]PVM84486.1 hypothetical protein DDF62_22410 [Caulobacter radicis]